MEETIRFDLADSGEVWLEESTVFCKIPALVSQIPESELPVFRRAMLTQVTGRVTRAVAAAMQLELHHVTWTVTDDPAQVMAAGRACGCCPCINGMDQTTAWMAENPGRWAGIGRHCWAQE